jgi:hypothetical protein
VNGEDFGAWGATEIVPEVPFDAPGDIGNVDVYPPDVFIGEMDDPFALGGDSFMPGELAGMPPSDTTWDLSRLSDALKTGGQIFGSIAAGVRDLADVAMGKRAAVRSQQPTASGTIVQRITKVATSPIGLIAGAGAVAFLVLRR